MLLDMDILHKDAELAETGSVDVVIVDVIQLLIFHKMLLLFLMMKKLMRIIEILKAEDKDDKHKID
uniref:Uncharacterized protein n=2 Tax=Meloidogyne TaxID=189290 RepID=A0A6V7U1L3_MELEN|nr:unnamed protein product [Meloidogyne enterolobii]